MANSWPLFIKMANPDSFSFFRSFQTNNTVLQPINVNNVMSIQYMAPGFKPTTTRTCFVSINHQTRAPSRPSALFSSLQLIVDEYLIKFPRTGFEPRSNCVTSTAKVRPFIWNLQRNQSSCPKVVRYTQIITARNSQIEQLWTKYNVIPGTNIIQPFCHKSWK